MKKRIPMPKAYVDELNAHPNVERATEWSVSFTKEFKKLAYDEYYRGKSMREIFEEAGFDVKMLGNKRIDNFQQLLMEKSKKDDSFADKRKDKSLQSPPSTEVQLQKRIRELEHLNAYLEQENEFLKKYKNWRRSPLGRQQSGSDHTGKVRDHSCHATQEQ